MAKVTLLGAKVLHFPTDARREVFQALRAHRGNVTHAAKALDVTHRCLRGWIVTLEMQPDLDKIRTDSKRLRRRPAKKSVL